MRSSHEVPTAFGAIKRLRRFVVVRYLIDAIVKIYCVARRLPTESAEQMLWQHGCVLQTNSAKSNHGRRTSAAVVEAADINAAMSFQPESIAISRPIGITRQ